MILHSKSYDFLLISNQDTVLKNINIDKDRNKNENSFSSSNKADTTNLNEIDKEELQN